MTENKRYTLRLHPKDNGVKIFNNHDEDNWRVLNLHFNDYEDAKFVREKLAPVVDLLNNLADENEQLKRANDIAINGLTLCQEKNVELEIENEQLKQQINNTIKELQTEKETAISKNERIRLDFAITVLEELKGDK